VHKITEGNNWVKTSSQQDLWQLVLEVPPSNIKWNFWDYNTDGGADYHK
jgi:hypothetical protein